MAMLSSSNCLQELIVADFARQCDSVGLPTGRIYQAKHTNVPIQTIIQSTIMPTHANLWALSQWMKHNARTTRSLNSELGIQIRNAQILHALSTCANGLWQVKEISRMLSWACLDTLSDRWFPKTMDPVGRRRTDPTLHV